LGFGQGRAQFVEFLQDHVLLIGRNHDPFFTGVVDEVLFGFLQPGFQTGELALQELRGLQGGVVTRLEVELNEFVGGGVCDLAGEFGIRRNIAEADQMAVPDRLHLQSALHDSGVG